MLNEKCKGVFLFFLIALFCFCFVFTISRKLFNFTGFFFLESTLENDFNPQNKKCKKIPPFHILSFYFHRNILLLANISLYRAAFYYFRGNEVVCFIVCQQFRINTYRMNRRIFIFVEIKSLFLTWL